MNTICESKWYNVLCSVYMSVHCDEQRRAATEIISA